MNVYIERELTILFVLSINSSRNFKMLSTISHRDTKLSLKISSNSVITLCIQCLKIIYLI